MERPALKQGGSGARRLMRALPVALAALAAGHLASATGAGVDTSRWPAFLEPTYGFGFRYPPGYRVRYYGPNLAMRQVMAGQPVSGTVPPSRQTIGFTRPNTPGFFAVVYGPPAQISPEMTAGGQCGVQVARRTLVNRIVRIRGLCALERRQIMPDGRIRMDYWIVLSTVRLFPPR